MFNKFSKKVLLLSIIISLIFPFNPYTTSGRNLDDQSYVMAIGIDDRHRPHEYSIRWRVIGGTIMATGVAWTTYFLVAANKVVDEQKIQASSLYRHNFQFSNGAVISIGADHLYNRILGCNTVGLGLSYNF